MTQWLSPALRDTPNALWWTARRHPLSMKVVTDAPQMSGVLRIRIRFAPLPLCLGPSTVQLELLVHPPRLAASIALLSIILAGVDVLRRHALPEETPGLAPYRALTSQPVWLIRPLVTRDGVRNNVLVPIILLIAPAWIFVLPRIPSRHRLAALELVKIKVVPLHRPSEHYHKGGLGPSIMMMTPSIIIHRHPLSPTFSLVLILLRLRLRLVRLT